MPPLSFLLFSFNTIKCVVEKLLGINDHRKIIQVPITLYKKNKKQVYVH